MDLDISSLWSWTIPLWGLFLIVLFLGGVLTQPTVLESISQAGGAVKTVRAMGRRVRFAADV
jgi:hypothetical protein